MACGICHDTTKRYAHVGGDPPWRRWGGIEIQHCTVCHQEDDTASHTYDTWIEWTTAHRHDRPDNAHLAIRYVWVNGV